MASIRVTVDGVTADVEILPSAVKAAEHLLDALPLEIPLEHATRSGNCAIATDASLRDESIPIEGQVSMYYPNMVAFDPARGYLVFAYGQGQARSATGTHWVTHFGTVVSGASELAARLQSTRDVGATTIRIENGA